jgi:glycine oxidase
MFQPRRSEGAAPVAPDRALPAPFAGTTRAARLPGIGLGGPAKPRPAPAPTGLALGDRTAADVTVVGAGVIGLCAALALADRGLRVCLIGESRAGEASPAAAGILATSLDNVPGRPIAPSIHRFAIAARDRYVSFLADLTERSGIAVPLNRLGLLEVATDEAEASALKQARRGQWLEPGQAAALEPGLGRIAGATYIEVDGAVDNLALLRALSQAVDCASRIVRIETAAARIAVDASGVTCTAADGESYPAASAVLAAGAWVGQIDGLPRPLPIDPLRGQMFSVVAPPTSRPRHVTYGPSAYLVPRGERTLIGATLERVGFDATTTAEGLSELRAHATAIWPAVADAPMVSSWAGLRPVTPDLLPIIGADPALPALVYACGHSRNGILMAPLTGDCVAAIVTGGVVPADVSAFAVDRFEMPAVRSI